MRKKKEERKNKEVTFVIPLDVPNKCNVIYSEKAMKPAVEEYLEKHKGKAMLFDTPIGKIVQGLKDEQSFTFAPNIIGNVKTEKQSDGTYCRTVMDCSIISIDIV